MAHPDPTHGCRLGGAAVGELQDLIVDAFDADDLEQLVKINTDVDLYEVVERNAPTRKLVFDLLCRFNKEGRTPLLLRSLLKARGARADLRAAIERHCPQALEALLPPGVEVQDVVTGLQTVQMQVECQPVREVIIASREKLNQLMEDIELLYDYKMLHDCLHIIQEQHYTLVDKVKRFRTDPLTSAELEEEIFNLQKVGGEARKYAEALPDRALVRAQELDWVKKLESAAAGLSRAVDNVHAHGAAHDAASAVGGVKRVIRWEPFRINRLLTLTAERLPLEELGLILEKVIDTIAAGETSAFELQQALRSLQSILPQLRGRVAEHRKWQDIENDFWEAEECIERHTPDAIEQFAESWPDIKFRVESLARMDAQAAWAKAIERHVVLIDRDLVDRVDSAINDFEYFRRAGLHRFAGVNKALLEQCTAILAIRAPLRSLLNATAIG